VQEIAGCRVQKVRLGNVELEYGSFVEAERLEKLGFLNMGLL
jgi:hypothetical protein